MAVFVASGQIARNAVVALKARTHCPAVRGWIWELKASSLGSTTTRAAKLIVGAHRHFTCFSSPSRVAVAQPCAAHAVTVAAIGIGDVALLKLRFQLIFTHQIQLALGTTHGLRAVLADVIFIALASWDARKSVVGTDSRTRAVGGTCTQRTILARPEGVTVTQAVNTLSLCTAIVGTSRETAVHS